jgi:hypothetical protein
MISVSQDIHDSCESDCTRRYKRERKHNAQSLPPGITHEMMKKYVVYYREINKSKGKITGIREYFKVEGHPKLIERNIKPWIGTKSGKIYLNEKLNEANQIVTDLEKNIYPSSHFVMSSPESLTCETNVLDSELVAESYTNTKYNESLNNHIRKMSSVLPKYVSIRHVNTNTNTTINTQSQEWFTLIYDKKDILNSFRWTASIRFTIDKTVFTNTQAIMPNISHEIQKLQEKLKEKYDLDLLYLS